MLRFEDILDAVESYLPGADEDLLRRAYIFSAQAHRHQLRSSGEPYLVHPIGVAMLLAELKLDEVSVATGLLHDVLEDTKTTKEDLATLFGPEVAEVVEVPVEDRPPDPGAVHDLADAELGVGALADQVGGRLEDPGTAPFARLPCSGFRGCRSHP